MVNGIRFLSLEDCSVGSCAREDELKTLPSLFLACRRPAVSALRRRYLQGLAQWPLDQSKSLYGNAEIGRRLDEALEVCRLFAAPTSPAWRQAEASIYRSLPAVYQGGAAPAPRAPFPRLSALLGQLQSHSAPAQCALGLARWSFFSPDMTSFSESWCDFLHSLSAEEWRLVASLRATPGPQSDASPLPGHHKSLSLLCRHTDSSWRRAIMPRVLQLSSTQQRLNILQGTVGLFRQDALDALEVARGAASDEDGGVEQVRIWLSLSAEQRKEVTDHFPSDAAISAPLLGCVKLTSGWPQVPRRRLLAALSGLMDEGRTAGMTPRHLEALRGWVRWRSQPMSWDALELISELQPKAAAAFVAYAERVPLDILALVRELSSTRDERDPGGRSPLDDDREGAVVRACCEAYLMGAKSRGGPTG